MIYRQMIERHQRYGWKKPEGEWGDIMAGQGHRDFRALLDQGDAARLRPFLDKRLFPDLCWGLLSPQRDAVSPNTLIRIWAMSTGSREEVLKGSVSMEILGNEEDVRTLDTLRHDHYAVQILRYQPERVLEIGGGYGGLALQLRRRSTVKLAICDLPQTLYLAWHYLSTRTEATIAWWDEDPDADVVLCPSHELTEYSPRVDMTFTAHALPEIPRDAALAYMEWINEHGGRYFYCDNPVTPPGKYEYPELSPTDLVPSGEKYVERWRRHYPWDGPESRYCETFYERVGA